MASFTIDAILTDESITGKEREELLRPIRKEIIGKKKGVKIFISLYESEENINLVVQLLEPFLTLLCFDVHYWRKDIKTGIPTEIIDDIIDNCDAIIGVYTKDDKIENNGYRPTGNVIRELGRERPKQKLILCEKGTKIESMTYSMVPAIHFERDKLGKLCLGLLKVIKNSEWLDVSASIK